MSGTFLRISALLVLGLLILLLPPLEARTWRVLSDSEGDAPTIQAAIDSAAYFGDEIRVGPGVYTENLDYSGKDVAIRSDAGPDATVVDGSGRDSSVVIFKRGEGPGAVLEGFTIRGGSGSRIHGNQLRWGAGILCAAGSPTISGNIIRDNATGYQEPGGGMMIGRGSWEGLVCRPAVTNNVFINNSSGQNGGAVAVTDPSEAILRANRFLENSARADGGAVWVWSHWHHTVVENNDFIANVAGDHGGGLYISNPGYAEPMIVEGNLFFLNRTLGTGFFGDTGSGGAIAALSIAGTISNNTLVANDGAHLTDCGGGGLLLYLTDATLTISKNIIALNKEGGIACWGGKATVQENLLWMNEGGDLSCVTAACDESWLDVMIIEDPRFCDLEQGNLTVASDSPALLPGRELGARLAPGCGPGTAEQVASWGSIKQRYR